MYSRFSGFCSLFAFSFSVPGVGWCLAGAGDAGRRLDWAWLGGLNGCGSGGGGHGGSLGGVAGFGVAGGWW